MDQNPQPAQTLRDVPDWRYLLQEYDELYRYLPAGGSDRIRGHQRKVREAITRLIRKNADLRPQPPEKKAGDRPFAPRAG